MTTTPTPDPRAALEAPCGWVDRCMEPPNAACHQDPWDMHHGRYRHVYVAATPAPSPVAVDVCSALSAWATVAEVSSRGAGLGHLAVAKSCLLDRLLNGGEKGPSQTPCPVHQGRWSGIHWGWDEEPMLMEWRERGCRCGTHRGCSCTTGWQPDENCCAATPEGGAR